MFGRLCARRADVEEGLLLNDADSKNDISGSNKEDGNTKANKDSKLNGDILVVKMLLPYLWTNLENKTRIIVALLFLILSKVSYFI
mgnify:CR=1 FL=1